MTGGKTPLGSSKCIWGHNVKMDLRETKYWGGGRIHLAQDRKRWSAFVNTVMHLRVP
jgi:hypothetical protein